MKVEIVSPSNQKVYQTIEYQTEQDALKAIHEAQTSHWPSLPLEQRIEMINKFVQCFVSQKDDICTELVHLIGRPFKHNFNEIKGFTDRAEYMASIAKDCLKPHHLPDKDGFTRYVERVPLGVVFVIAPWNYPYLCMVNTVIPALLAGNTVIMKQAPQTFPTADRLGEAFKMAGFPVGAYASLHVDHDVAAKIIHHPSIQFVQFTGSVRGGLNVKKQTVDRFIGTGFELGGKDPAFVRSDADLDLAAENIVDGAMYNSGQSCCAVERIYVHEQVYNEFVEKCVKIVMNYKLGDPLKEDTNLGPVINVKAAANIRNHIADAVAKGAKCLIDEFKFPIAQPGTAFVAPQILVNVNHTMKIMKEETFGPVVGIQKVSSDEEAIQLMNDSEYGLTASIWTKDRNAAIKIGNQIQTGTVFMNRCDCLDPGLCWAGVKNSGCGTSLSKFGYDALTRPKSYHLRH